MTLTISILGFGNIGKCLCSLLLPYKEHVFNINIIDTDDKVKGAILDFEHGSQFHSNHTITYNNTILFNNSDFIFHCAGASVPKGESRFKITQKSIEITESIFKNFNPSKTPFIIIVANPVEVISTVTYKLTGLPKNHIIGTGTLLDSIRMDHLINKTISPQPKTRSIILGEHGKTAFLSNQLSIINGISFNKYFDKKKIKEYMNLVKNAANKIKNTQEATIYGVSYCAIHIFELLTSQKTQNIPASILIPENLKKNIGNHDVFISMYCSINKFGIKPSQAYKPNTKELTYLKTSIETIIPFIPKKYL